jgi:hypothetical protein
MHALLVGAFHLHKVIFRAELNTRRIACAVVFIDSPAVKKLCAKAQLGYLIKSIPPTLKYEAGTILAEGDFVIVHGRFSDFGAPVNWIAADIVRIEAGKLAEHWDVIQDEATKEQSKSGAPMFGTTFPTYAGKMLQ